ncbi:YeeE/YedE family protein [Sulfuriferula thiophila]|uniref:YeeE/YedE family protein n=1 Tax=Sulfuriferula thiophila TaxID=1781211 RepID=UPI000F60B545|nr:YeeE/YedE family protein [Sulfuriferula thiophila]
MLFDSFAQAQSVLLWATFGLAMVLGLVANKTNFCTMGAISDWVNMGDLGRMRAWMLAMAVAMLGVSVLEYFGLANLDASFPPYRGAQLIWAENILGGVLFGIGMTFASGCGNKTLIRIGGGNIKSIIVLMIIAVIAYFMVNPFPGTDKTLFTVLFNGWIRPLAVNVGSHQDLASFLVSDASLKQARLVLGVLVALAIAVFVFKSADFRSNRDNIIGGLVVGLTVLGAWYISSVIGVKVDGTTYTLQGYVQEWDFVAGSADIKPADSRPLSPQSFTFINPMGQTLGYVAGKFDISLLTFGVMALAGVIAGSLLWSLLSRNFRIEWFASFADFRNHVFGAILMGFGGVLAMGCTIGQGITGMSTLALGSFLALISIIFGSAITMRVQYYKLVYEADASFIKALLSSLVDFKLLPSFMRKLEAV